jgi:hypothetical protein
MQIHSSCVRERIRKFNRASKFIARITAIRDDYANKTNIHDIIE